MRNLLVVVWFLENRKSIILFTISLSHGDAELLDNKIHLRHCIVLCGLLYRPQHRTPRAYRHWVCIWAATTIQNKECRTRRWFQHQPNVCIQSSTPANPHFHWRPTGFEACGLYCHTHSHLHQYWSHLWLQKPTTPSTPTYLLDQGWSLGALLKWLVCRWMRNYLKQLWYLPER